MEDPQNKPETRKATTKLTVKSVKHVPVKSGVRAGSTQNHGSSKNANNGE